jgi:hypothetical protein
MVKKRVSFPDDWMPLVSISGVPVGKVRRISPSEIAIGVEGYVKATFIICAYTLLAVMPPLFVFRGGIVLRILAIFPQ